MGVRKERNRIKYIFNDIVKSKEFFTYIQHLNYSEHIIIDKKNKLLNFFQGISDDKKECNSKKILLKKHLHYFFNLYIRKYLYRIEKTGKNKNPVNRDVQLYALLKFMISNNIISQKNFDFIVENRFYFNDEILFFVLESPDTLSSLYFKYIYCLRKNKLIMDEERFKIRVKEYLFNYYILYSDDIFFQHVLKDLSLNKEIIMTLQPELHWDVLFQTSNSEKIKDYFLLNPSQGDINEKNVLANYFIKSLNIYTSKKLNLSNLSAIGHFCNFKDEDLEEINKNIKRLLDGQLIEQERFDALHIEILKIKSEKEDALLRKYITSSEKSIRQKRI